MNTIMVDASNIEWIADSGDWSYGVAELADGRWASVWHLSGDLTALPVDGAGDESGALIHDTREEAVAAVREMVEAL